MIYSITNGVYLLILVNTIVSRIPVVKDKKYK